MLQLRELDRVLEGVAASLSSSDLLVVVGDHGMTSSGDHGGDSDNEIWAGLMVYTSIHGFYLGSFVCSLSS